MTSPCVCTTVRKANRALFRHYERAFSRTGISQIQFSILRQLERSGPTPLAELAEALVMERTSLYRSIRPLTDSGAVALAPGANRRIKVASLTQKGRELIDSAEPIWRRTQERVVHAIGEESWRQLSAVLLAIPELIQAQGESV